MQTVPEAQVLTATSSPCFGASLIVSMDLIVLICKVGLKADLPPKGSCKDEVRQVIYRTRYIVNPQ